MDPYAADETIDVLFVMLDPSVPEPRRAHPGDAGWDLHARHDAHLEPRGGRALISTGLAIALPAGSYAAVLPRSGLAARHGVTVLNAPGTIDAGYRGEIGVVLVNHDPDHACDIRAGDRIAQLVVHRLPPVVFHRADRLPGSARGAGGYGSTGR